MCAASLPLTKLSKQMCAPRFNSGSCYYNVCWAILCGRHFSIPCLSVQSDRLKTLYESVINLYLHMRFLVFAFAMWHVTLWCWWSKFKEVGSTRFAFCLENILCLRNRSNHISCVQIDLGYLFFLHLFRFFFRSLDKTIDDQNVRWHMNVANNVASLSMRWIFASGKHSMILHFFVDSISLAPIVIAFRVRQISKWSTFDDKLENEWENENIEIQAMPILAFYISYFSVCVQPSTLALNRKDYFQKIRFFFLPSIPFILKRAYKRQKEQTSDWIFGDCVDVNEHIFRWLVPVSEWKEKRSRISMVKCIWLSNGKYAKQKCRNASS